MKNFKTLNTVYNSYDHERLNIGRGFHWYDRDTMRFFHCRIAESSFTHWTTRFALFVSSEKMDYNSPRLYTVRLADKLTGAVETVYDLGDFKTLAQARREIAHLIKQELTCKLLASICDHWQYVYDRTIDSI